MYTKKKIKNVLKILKKHLTGELKKRYEFAPGATNHTFFDSPCIISKSTGLEIFKI